MSVILYLPGPGAFAWGKIGRRAGVDILGFVCFIRLGGAWAIGQVDNGSLPLVAEGAIVLFGLALFLAELMESALYSVNVLAKLVMRSHYFFYIRRVKNNALFV